MISLKLWRISLPCLLFSLLAPGESARGKPRCQDWPNCQKSQISTEPHDLRGYSFLQPAPVDEFLKEEPKEPKEPMEEDKDKALWIFDDLVIGLTFLAVMGIGLLVLTIWWYFIKTAPKTEEELEAEDEAGATQHLESSLASQEATPPDEQLAALKAQKARLMLHNVISKRKLQDILTKIINREAELRNEKAPSQEEILRQVDDAVQAANVMAEKRLLTALAYVAPFAMQGQRMQLAFEERTKAAKERMAAVAWEESINMCSSLQNVFGVGDVSGKVFESISKVEIPSLVTILASAFAPAQLRFKNLVFQICLLQNFLIFLLSAVTWITVDRRQCACALAAGSWANGKLDHLVVPLWFEVDMMINGVSMFIRLWVVITIMSALKHVDESPPIVMNKTNPVLAVRALLDFYLTTGAEALLRLDTINNSLIITAVGYTVLLDFIWGIFGIDVMLNLTWRDCRGWPIICLRFRMILFLMCFIPILVTVAIFLAGKFVRTDRLKLVWLSSAIEMDNSLGLGLPLASILVQAFLVTNRADTIHMRLRVLELRKQQTTEERLAMEEKLRTLNAAEAGADQEIEALDREYHKVKRLTKPELHALDQEVKEKILFGAESVFKEINSKAQHLSADAEKQVKEWQQNGTPEFIDALAAAADQIVNDPLATSHSLQKKAEEQAASMGLDVSQEAMEQMFAQAREKAQAVQDKAKGLAESAQATALLASGAAPKAAAPGPASPGTSSQ